MRFPCAPLTTLGLFLAGTACLADPVTLFQARQAVQGWLQRSPAPMRTPLSADIASIETHQDLDGRVLFHEVRLAPEGFVIVAPDDYLEPVIAFAEHGVLSTDPESHLFLMLQRDLRARLDRLPGSARKGRLLAAHSEALSRWQRLTGAAVEPVLASVSTVSDVRVAPLLVSTWNQNTGAGGVHVFDYFIPNLDPCGCVATAMAQLLYKHKTPTAGIGVHAFSVTVSGVAQTLSTKGGDGLGGPYPWDTMPASPSLAITQAQTTAIGGLCYDAALTVNMSFDTAAAGGSGAYLSDAATALKSTFTFANTIYGNVGGELTGHGLTEMVLPGLDAGYPSILGISGAAGGHAIVDDGYGYNLGTLYHHLNMGWGGYDNAWYNLPNLDSNPSFNLITDCIYNAFPTGSGDLLTGRITDGSGNGIAGVTVTSGATNGTTNANGIYALKGMASGLKTVSATKAGLTFPQAVRLMGGPSTDGATVGNLWGVDLVQGTGATPTITPAPLAQNVKLGGSATFTAGATGIGPLSFQWTKNGTAVGTNSPVYTLTSATAADDQASIVLRVTGAQGHADSVPVTVSVVPLINGDFESGNLGWNLWNNSVVLDASYYAEVLPHGGGHWLCIGDWAQPTTDYAMQDIPVPADNIVDLNLWVGITNKSKTPAPVTNVFKVKVLNATTRAELATLLTLDNTNAQVDGNGQVVWKSYGPYNLKPWQNQNVTLRIESVQPGATDTGTVFAVDDVSLAISNSGPKATVDRAAYTMVTGGQAPFTATVTGYASDNRVDWSVGTGGGTFNPTRTAGDGATPTLFTAGAGAGSFTVLATPVEASSVAGSTALTLVAPANVAVGLVPSATTVLKGGGVTLAATVTPLTDTAVVWTASGGAFSTTLPAAATWSASTGGTYTLTATSHGAPTRAASTQITVVDTATINLALAPGGTTLLPGASQAFTASGDQGYGVTWSLTAPATHADAGLTTTVTVPAAAPLATTVYTLTAAHALDATRTATVPITVKGMDLIADGALSPRDLLGFAAEWGKGTASPANFKGAGTVDDTDLTALLNQLQ